MEGGGELNGAHIKVSSFVPRNILMSFSTTQGALYEPGPAAPRSLGELIPRKARWVSGSIPKSKWLFEKMQGGGGEELAVLVSISRVMPSLQLRGCLALRGEPGKHVITHGHHLFVIQGNETLTAAQKLRNEANDLKIDIEEFKRA